MEAEGATRFRLLCGLGPLAVGALGGTVVGVLLWLSAEERDVTHRFIGAVRARRDDVAYALSSTDLRARVPPGTFGVYVDQAIPYLRTSRSEYVNGFTGGSDHACLDLWLWGTDALPASAYVLLVTDGGQWRVSGLSASEPEECEAD